MTLLKKFTGRTKHYTLKFITKLQDVTGESSCHE